MFTGDCWVQVLFERSPSSLQQRKSHLRSPFPALLRLERHQAESTYLIGFRGFLILVPMSAWNSGTKGATDTKMDKGEETRQRTKAESSLLILQQRLAYDSTAGFRPTTDASYGKERHISNPFPSPPLPFILYLIRQYMVCCSLIV